VEPTEAWLRAGLLPAAASSAAAGASWLLRSRPRARGALLALGVGLAFSGALWACGVRPSLPLAPGEDAWTCLVWIAPAVALLASLPLPETARTVASIAAMAWVVEPLLATAWPRALVAGAVAAAAWAALSRERAHRALALLPPLLALPAAFWWWGRSVAFAGSAAILAVAVLPVAPLLRTAHAPAGVAAVVFVGLVLSGVAYLDYGATTRFPWPAALLLAAAPLFALARRRAVAAGGSWVTILAALAVLARQDAAS
jgi:hypothetical protein